MYYYIALSFSRLVVKHEIRIHLEEIQIEYYKSKHRATMYRNS